MEVSIQEINKLRKETNAPLMDCKRALIEAGGDAEKAKKILREMGIMKMANRDSKAATEGQIFSYVHPGGKLAVLVEIACETDFVARCEDFQKLGKEAALQCAGMNPRYVVCEDIPAEILEEEKELIRKQLGDSNKPPQVLEKIVEGKLKKFYEETVLMEQPYFRDETKKFKEVFQNMASKFGEAVKITRFTRYEIGK